MEESSAPSLVRLKKASPALACVPRNGFPPHASADTESGGGNENGG
jgi:hypothetical protein